MGGARERVKARSSLEVGLHPPPFLAARPLRTKIIAIKSGVTWTGLQRGSSMPVGVGVELKKPAGRSGGRPTACVEGRQYTTIPWLMLDCRRL